MPPDVIKPIYPKEDVYKYLASVGIPARKLKHCCIRKGVVTGLSDYTSVNLTITDLGDFAGIPVYVHTDCGARLSLVKGVEEDTANSYFKDASLMFPLGEKSGVSVSPEVLIVCYTDPKTEQTEPLWVIQVMQAVNKSLFDGDPFKTYRLVVKYTLELLGYLPWWGLTDRYVLFREVGAYDLMANSIAKMPTFIGSSSSYTEESPLVDAVVSIDLMDAEAVNTEWMLNTFFLGGIPLSVENDVIVSSGYNGDWSYKWVDVAQNGGCYTNGVATEDAWTFESDTTSGGGNITRVNSGLSSCHGGFYESTRIESQTPPYPWTEDVDFTYPSLIWGDCPEAFIRGENDELSGTNLYHGVFEYASGLVVTKSANALGSITNARTNRDDATTETSTRNITYSEEYSLTFANETITAEVSIADNIGHYLIKYEKSWSTPANFICNFHAYLSTIWNQSRPTDDPASHTWERHSIISHTFQKGNSLITDCGVAEFLVGRINNLPMTSSVHVVNQIPEYTGIRPRLTINGYYLIPFNIKRSLL